MVGNTIINVNNNSNGKRWRNNTTTTTAMGTSLCFFDSQMIKYWLIFFLHFQFFRHFVVPFLQFILRVSLPVCESGSPSMLFWVCKSVCVCALPFVFSGAAFQEVKTTEHVPISIHSNDHYSGCVPLFMAESVDFCQRGWCLNKWIFK